MHVAEARTAHCDERRNAVLIEEQTASENRRRALGDDVDVMVHTAHAVDENRLWKSNRKRTVQNRKPTASHRRCLSSRQLDAIARERDVVRVYELSSTRYSETIAPWI